MNTLEIVEKFINYIAPHLAITDHTIHINNTKRITIQESEHRLITITNSTFIPHYPNPGDNLWHKLLTYTYAPNTINYWENVLKTILNLTGTQPSPNLHLIIQTIITKIPGANELQTPITPTHTNITLPKTTKNPQKTTHSTGTTKPKFQ